MHSDLFSTSSGRVFKIKMQLLDNYTNRGKDYENGRIVSLGLCIRTSVSPEAHVMVGDCSVSLERSFLELLGVLCWGT